MTDILPIIHPGQTWEHNDTGKRCDIISTHGENVGLAWFEGASHYIDREEFLFTFTQCLGNEPFTATNL